MNERFQKQLDFLIEIDKLKSIYRRTKLFDGSRHENDAEHSWHLSVMAIILSEHSNEPIDLAKVIKMVLIHDIVEIDAGDYILYTDKTSEKDEAEMRAAKRLFNILPEEQKNELFNLWVEFEQRESAEARFAAAIDRLEPIMQNYFTDALTWRENQIRAEEVLKVNRRIEKGSNTLWEYAKGIIEDCMARGLIS